MNAYFPHHVTNSATIHRDLTNVIVLMDITWLIITHVKVSILHTICTYVVKLIMISLIKYGNTVLYMKS